MDENQVKQIISELVEQVRREKIPGMPSLIFFAALTSGITSYGTNYVNPIDPRPDPYTGTQAFAETEARKAADKNLQRQLEHLQQEQKGHDEEIEWCKRQIWSEFRAARGIVEP